MIITIPYTPQPHQRQLHESRTRFVVAVAGRQIGKTVAVVNEIIKRAVSTPGTRNWYVTNSYVQAKRNVWDLFKRFCPKELIAGMTSSPPVIRLVNGSLIELIGVENAEQLRGAVVNFMALDEYADFPRFIWPEVLRPMLSTTGGGVWFIGTPKGLGNDFYDKYNETNPQFTKFKFPACEVQNGKVINMLSTFAKQDEIQNAFDTSPKDAFNQEYLADFTRPTGTVYSEWPLENFTDVNYDPLLPVHISMDFGVNDPTSLIWFQPTGSEFRVIDYYEASDANIDHFVSVIRSKPYRKAELYTGDDAGRARTLTTGTSVIDELSKKDIFVRTKPGLRIENQIREVHKHIKSLYVSNKCDRFRDILLNYRYPSIKETARNQENELPIHDQFSHGARALEYYFSNYEASEPVYQMPVINHADNVIGI